MRTVIPAVVERPTVWAYLDRQWPKVLEMAIEQVLLVLVVVLITTVISVFLGLLLWRRMGLSEAVSGVFGGILTIPSLALLVLFIPIFGLGWQPAIIALVLYAQLPVFRNTVVGMRAVDPAILEAARGMGMSESEIVRRIQLPLAWPYILAGLRVTTMMVFGISAIAAYVGGPGLGDLMFSGLAQLGSFNSFNQAIVGAVGITLLALAFDGGYVLLRQITTKGGLRVA